MAALRFTYPRVVGSIEVSDDETRATENLSAPTEFDRKYLELIKEVGERALELLAELRFNRRDRAQLAAICIYATIIELYNGCLVLLKAEQYSAVPIIVRSLTESHADLAALSLDREYWKHLHSSNLKEQLRLGKNVCPDHPFLAHVFAGGNVGERMKELEAELALAKKAGRGPISTAKRFELARLEAEAQSIYWLLCLEGHNNLAALEGRHLAKNADSDDYHVVAFREEWDSIRTYLDGMIVPLLRCSQIIHQMLETGCADCFDEFARRREKLVKDLPAAA